ncbi:hypothetical protein [Candidatus Amarolinea dominans]|uniref:hypothetical protein n=1 Tax=Candidatus Amarolinea dominans TaxID=3140696 RepID=UPI001D8BDE63|nr:hypothetical protein [Anaerolineae bacterium]
MRSQEPALDQEGQGDGQHDEYGFTAGRGQGEDQREQRPAQACQRPQKNDQANQRQQVIEGKEVPDVEPEEVLVEHEEQGCQQRDRRGERPGQQEEVGQDDERQRGGHGQQIIGRGVGQRQQSGQVGTEQTKGEGLLHGIGDGRRGRADLTVVVQIPGGIRLAAIGNLAVQEDHTRSDQEQKQQESRRLSAPDDRFHVPGIIVR